MNKKFVLTTVSNTPYLGYLPTTREQWMACLQKALSYTIYKAKRCLGALSRISNSNGGIAPRAARLMYTGAIRPLMTYGAEVWWGLRKPGGGRQAAHPEEPLVRVEDEALRKVIGAFRGSDRRKVGWIAGVELVCEILRDLQMRWAARAVRNGDPEVRRAAGTALAEGTAPWYAANPNEDTLDSPIARAFHLLGGAQPEEFSWGTSKITGRPGSRTSQSSNQGTQTPR